MDWTVQLLESTLGPQGLKVLVDTGQSQSLCSLGVELVDLFKAVNPFLIRGTRETERVIGDRAKSFLLIVTVTLLQAVKDSEKYGSQCKETLVQVSKFLEGFALEIGSIHSGRTSLRNAHAHSAQMMLNLRRAVVVTPSTDEKLLQSSCVKLISTSLGNSCSYVAKRRMKKVLIEMLFPKDRTFTNMEKHVVNCEKALSHNYLMNTPLSVTETRVDRGFLLESSHPHLQTGARLKTVLLLSGIELESTQACIEIGHKGQLQKLLHFQEHFTNRLAEHLQRNNVRLLICSGKLCTQALQVLQASHIGVVQLISDETLVSIAESNHTHPFSNPVEMMHSDRFSLSSITVQCIPANIGKKRYTLLQTTPLSGTSCDPLALVLCAPTPSHVHTLHKLLLRTLTVVKNWLQSCSEKGELVGVAGGGVWEVELIREMNDYMSTQKLVRGSPGWIAVNSLMKGYLSIPRALYTNSLSSQKRTLPGTMKLFHIKVFNNAGPLVGLDPQTGGLEPVGLVDDWSVLEPANSVFLSQALRVDHVISVPMVTRETGREDSTDGED